MKKPTNQPYDDSSDEPFSMKIEFVFNIINRGIVVGGVVKSGHIKIGDTIEISGMDKPTVTTTITGIEAFKHVLKSAHTGDTVGLLFREVKFEQITEGMIVSSPKNDK